MNSKSLQRTLSKCGICLSTILCSSSCLSTQDNPAGPPAVRTKVAATVGIDPLSLLPFEMEATYANLNNCDVRDARRTALGTFKGYSVRRQRADVKYASSDSAITRYTTFALNRIAKKSTEVVQCVLLKGSAASKFISDWSRSGGTASTTPAVAYTFASGFDGNTIWCVAQDASGYDLDCNGVICTYGAAAFRSGEPQKDVALSAAGVGGWLCRNGATVYLLASGEFGTCQ